MRTESRSNAGGLLPNSPNILARLLSGRSRAALFHLGQWELISQSLSSSPENVLQDLTRLSWNDGGDYFLNKMGILLRHSFRLNSSTLSSRPYIHVQLPPELQL